MPAADFATYQKRVGVAARKADTDPTEAQREAGNHAVGSVHIHGYRISITHPEGSIRRGCGKDGKEWSRVMAKAHYGYVRGTKAADAECLDVFVGPHPVSQLAFAFEFLTGDEEHDEWKVVIGCRNLNEAKGVIAANYPDGWLDTRIGEVRGMFMPDLRKFLVAEGIVKPNKR